MYALAHFDCHHDPFTPCEGKGPADVAVPGRYCCRAGGSKGGYCPDSYACYSAACLPCLSRASSERGDRCYSVLQLTSTLCLWSARGSGIYTVGAEAITRTGSRVRE